KRIGACAGARAARAAAIAPANVENACRARALHGRRQTLHSDCGAKNASRRIATASQEAADAPLVTPHGSSRSHCRGEVALNPAQRLLPTEALTAPSLEKLPGARLSALPFAFGQSRQSRLAFKNRYGKL